MKKSSTEKLTAAEMTYVLGGGRWVWDEDSGDWYWVD